MRKAFVVLVPWLLACSGIGSVAAPPVPMAPQDQGECRDGQRQCSGSTAQECVDGAWVSVVNCAAAGGDLGAHCEMLGADNPLTGCHSDDLTGRPCVEPSGMYSCGDGERCCLANVMYQCRKGKLVLRDHCDLRGATCTDGTGCG